MKKIIAGCLFVFVGTLCSTGYFGQYNCLYMEVHGPEKDGWRHVSKYSHESNGFWCKK